MIKVCVYRNNDNEIYGFKSTGHGLDIVCSAVSALSINTVNSIENFTDLKFECEYEKGGGFLKFEIPFIKDGGHNHDANLLLESLFFGLSAIKEQYGEHINIID